ncbi:Serine/threonine-protein kinase Nek11, partial [Plecturocebus cupreus]
MQRQSVSFKASVDPLDFPETGSCSDAQAKVQWYNHCSLQPPTPRAKQSSCLSWNYSHMPPCPANFLKFCKEKVLKEISVGELNPNETVQASLEAQLLSKLDHPAIVKFHASFVEQDNFCIITEYCEIPQFPPPPPRPPLPPPGVPPGGGGAPPRGGG